MTDDITTTEYTLVNYSSYIEEDKIKKSDEMAVSESEQFLADGTNEITYPSIDIINSIDEEIQAKFQYILAMSTNNPMRGPELSCLGSQFNQRYALTNDPSDLEKAVEFATEATQVTAADNPYRICCVHNLGDLHMAEYNHTQKSEYLDKAVKVTQEIVDAMNLLEQADFHIILSLDTIYDSKISESTSMDDLDRAIQVKKAVVDMAPENDPKRVLYLVNLAVRLKDKALKVQSPRYIDEGVDRLKQAMVLTTEDNPYQQLCWRYIGILYHQRYQLQLGSLKDLEESIWAARQSIDCTLQTPIEKAANLDSLSARLWCRYLGNEPRTDNNKADKVSDETLHMARTCLAGSAHLEIDSTACRTEQCANKYPWYDLDESIRLIKQALKIGEHDGPIWADRQYKLFRCLINRYKEREVFSDLLESVRCIKKVIEATDNPNERPEILKQAGESMEMLFRKFGRISDIEKAIQLGKEAVAITSKAETEWPKYQSLVAVWLGYQYSKTSNMTHLEEAILVAREAAEGLQSDHEHKAFCAETLGNLLDKRFTRTRFLSDAEESIRCIREAINATPVGHEDGPARLMELGWQIGQKYQQFGVISDLTEAIAVSREAMDQILVPSSDRARVLYNLGHLLEQKYSHTEQKSDLDEAIAFSFEGLDIISEEHEMRSLLLLNLAVLMRMRYALTSDLKILDEAVRFARESIAKLSETSKNISTHLNELGANLRTRFEASRNTLDIEEAIKVQKDALSRPATTHRAANLNNLALSLYTLYWHEGNLEDLDECIELSREAVKTTPQDHNDWFDRQSNLGEWLRSRYSRVGRLADLSEAIEIGYLITKEASQSRQNRHIYLNNLSLGIHDRYSRTNKKDDLDEAIRIAREAVNLEFNEKHSQESSLNLAAWLFVRYKIHGHESDYDEVYNIGTQALDDPAMVALRQKSVLNNLSAILCYKYKKTGRLEYLQNAIEYCRKAVDATKLGPANSAGVLANLGDALGKKYIHTKDDRHLEEAVSCFKKAANNPHAPVNIRLLANGELMKYLALSSRWQDAFQVANTAINQISQMVLRSLGNKDKLNLLAQVQALASDAASAALGAGQLPALALSLLEQGRGFLGNSIRELRTDVSKLNDDYPGMAERFNAMKDKMKQAQLRDSMDDSQVSLEKNLDEKFEKLLLEIRTCQGFEDLLKAPSTFNMQNAAANGPIVVINVSAIRCDAILIEKHQIRCLPLERLSWDKIAEKAHDARQNPASPHILEWMWDDIVCPILEKLGLSHRPDHDNWPRIWWVPTGLLTHFPLHAAGYHAENSFETTMDRVMSSYSTSVKTILLSRQQPSVTSGENATAVLVAMEHTPPHAHLPFAPQEINEIRALCEDMKITTLEPPRRRHEILSSLQDCTIFHFAGHGHTNMEDPSMSYLLLEDENQGPFTVANLWELNHKRSPFLAYLSACGTGSIKDERLLDESIHLIGACQIAGFRHVIGTLWEVKDQECVDMARGVYESMRDGNMTDESVCLGIHNATRALRDQWLLSIKNGEESGFSRNAKLVNDGELSGALNWAPYVHFGV